MFAVSFLTVRQLTVDGFFRGCSYGLLGVGFAMILGVTGRFHFAYGFTYTLAVYLAYTFTFRSDFPFWPSAIAAVLLTACLGAGIERVVYRPLAANAGSTALLAIFVAALGLGIAGENVIRLFWGSQSQAYYGPTQVRHQIWDAVYINFDLWQAASGIVIVIVLTSMLRFTSLGRRIKATRSNPDLARTIGINADNTYLICFFIGTLCAGVSAVWFGLKFTVDPAMGSSPVIYSFVVAFLAGTASSPVRVFITGIIVALIEQYSSIWLSVRWTQTAVFVVLVGYLSLLAFRSSAFRAKLRVPKLAGA
ncbi:MAG: branched-chain amino acid transporter permease [Ilumatobacteraceae bacterium]|nr:branched-chain amino acid transporter permease [Ilumatobacteraceae bacterium]